MDYRAQLVAVVLAAGVAASAGADMIAVPDGIAVKESTVATPSRGMTMDQVASKFGAPVTKVPAVGQPPISRWEYPGFVVYFEHERVIHTVVAGGSSDSSATPAPPAAPAEPAAAQSGSGDVATASPAGDAATASPSGDPASDAAALSSAAATPSN